MFFAVIMLSCADGNNLSTDKEEAVVRKETTKLAHYKAWRRASFDFFLKDVHDLLWNFQYMPMHRWDFGDYRAAEASQRLSDCQEQAYENVWKTDAEVFKKSYADYMEQYYVPSRYHYVSDDERILADI